MTARKSKAETTRAVFNTPPEATLGVRSGIVSATLDDVDAQRQYAETLFTTAIGRVEKSVERILTERLTAALEVARPGKLVKLPAANTAAALLLKSRLTDLLERYHELTGQRVVRIECEGTIKVEVAL